jgi:hypothetical protein
MPYLQRNLSYVRVSPHAVLQTILYVDPSNLRWLNSGLYSDNDDEIDLTAEQEGNNNDEGERERTGDRVWARALSHLRERVMPKLRRESAENGLLASNYATSRGKVDTHIDVDFQMAYFFRQTTGRHAVLLKVRNVLKTKLISCSKNLSSEQGAHISCKGRNAASDATCISDAGQQR